MSQRYLYLAAFSGVLASFVASAITVGSLAQAAPSDAEANFLTEVYQYAHPQVSPQLLIQLGHQTCAVRRAGGSNGDAKVAISKTLWSQGFDAIGAEVGSLTHNAVDTLCPEVGYP